MSRSIFAFFVAVLVHVVLLLLFYILLSMAPKAKPSPAEKKFLVSLKELPKKIDKVEPIATQEQPKILKYAPLPKGGQFKELVKEPVILKKTQKKKIPKLNTIKKAKAKKVKIKPTLKKIPSKKLYIPVKRELKVKPNNMDWLFEDKSMFEEKKTPIKTQNGASAGRNIKELYGDEFGKLSAGQQAYILDNMEIMRRITQEVLNRQASVANINNLRVESSNVVEFYLHPNGDMSDFKFLKKSGYYVLDDITKSTIQFSYSKYPYPKEKTLIRYNVLYHLR